MSEVDQGIGVASRAVAQVDLGVGDRPRRGQRAQRRADDLRSLPIELATQFIAAAAVGERQPPAGLGGVVRGWAVGVEVGQDPGVKPGSYTT
ncbi:MAG: hypothetical protein ACRDQU_04920 [Pseudonocardiaceae bacterium]